MALNHIGSGPRESNQSAI